MHATGLCVEDAPAVRRAALLVQFVAELRPKCAQWPPELLKVTKEIIRHANIQVQGPLTVREQDDSKHSLLVWACAQAAALGGGEAAAGTTSTSCGISRGTVINAIKKIAV
jgi:hypothetical protein